MNIFYHTIVGGWEAKSSPLPLPQYSIVLVSAKKWNKKIPGALQLNLTQLSFEQNSWQLDGREHPETKKILNNKPSYIYRDVRKVSKLSPFAND